MLLSWLSRKPLHGTAAAKAGGGHSGAGVNGSDKLNG